jgi:hypothetical protein
MQFQIKAEFVVDVNADTCHWGNSRKVVEENPGPVSPGLGGLSVADCVNSLVDHSKNFFEF